MIPALIRRDYGYGSGVISPNLTLFIVNIPKNASSFVSSWTNKFGWHAALAENHEHRIAEMIVILRDPLDRWISGISQYLNGYILHARGAYDISCSSDSQDQYMDATTFINQYNSVIERLIFDNLDRHDDHVWPQNEIIEGLLPTKSRRYYYLDDTLEEKLSQYLGIPTVAGIDRNPGENNKDQRILQMFFRDKINQQPKLKQRIIDRYQKDYELIEQVLPCR